MNMQLINQEQLCYMMMVRWNIGWKDLPQRIKDFVMDDDSSKLDFPYKLASVCHKLS